MSAPCSRESLSNGRYALYQQPAPDQPGPLSQFAASRSRNCRRSGRTALSAGLGILLSIHLSLAITPLYGQPANELPDPPVRPLPGQPDWQGLKRDTWYFMGAQVASLGVLYALPEAVSSWSEEQKDNFSLDKWWENVSDPHLDGDDFYLNYILHPYWGATYYVRARERGYGQREAFWYSAFLSTFYEMGPEALFEQPSIQDLVVTPVFGAWLGEYFMRIRRTIRQQATARGYRSRGESWSWYLTDPLDLINTGVRRMLGEKVSYSFQPLLGVSPRVAAWGLTGRPANLHGEIGPGMGPYQSMPVPPAGFGPRLSTPWSNRLHRAGSLRTHRAERYSGISVTLTW